MVRQAGSACCYDLDPIQGQGQGHGASKVPKIALLSISSAILVWSSKLMPGHDSTGPSLQLFGSRFSKFFLRKLSREFKLPGMSILHEFQMAIFPYCWTLRSGGRARW